MSMSLILIIAIIVNSILLLARLVSIIFFPLKNLSAKGKNIRRKDDIFWTTIPAIFIVASILLGVLL